MTSLYHDHDALDTLGQRFISTFLPIVGTFGLFSQHHGRAMGEEMYWCEAYHCESEVHTKENSNLPILSDLQNHFCKNCHQGPIAGTILPCAHRNPILAPVFRLELPYGRSEVTPHIPKAPCGGIRGCVIPRKLSCTLYPSWG